MRYLLVFPMGDGSDDQCEEFEGTLDDAVREATVDRRHLNYGRNGVKIFDIGSPMFVDDRSTSTQTQSTQHWPLKMSFADLGRKSPF